MPEDEPDPLVVVVVLDEVVVGDGAPWVGAGLGPPWPTRAAAGVSAAAVVVVVEGVGGGEPRWKNLTEPTLDGGRRSADTGVSVQTSAARTMQTMTMIVERVVKSCPSTSSRIPRYGHEVDIDSGPELLEQPRSTRANSVAAGTGRR